MAGEKDWEAENAADTLLRAEELKAKPSLLKKAMGILGKRQTALNDVMDEKDGAAVRRERRGK